MEPTSQSSYERQESERHRSYQEQIASLQRDLQRLDAELKRKDQRLQYVIDHYERLLAEKNRKLERQTPPESDVDGLSKRFLRVRRWLTR